MTSTRRKTIATILIALVSVLLFFAFMYVIATNEKNIPIYSPLIFAILPAMAINAIWSKPREI
jgi:O-antigen/teichoic acid export membrane protein